MIVVPSSAAPDVIASRREVLDGLSSVFDTVVS